MQNEQTSVCEHSERPTALYDPAIPLPLFTLIGREQELARMKQKLQDGNNATLTLHGLPGVGKTSLAITLAHDPEVRDAFSDGILWVGVGPNPNLPSLLSRWASLVGISATQMATLREIDEWAFAIRNAIGTRKMLLIIDDVWHFEEVQTLRVGAHNCAYLITTRSRDIAAHLALDGTMMISELNTEQSVQLLNRTMQGVGSSASSDANLTCPRHIEARLAPIGEGHRKGADEASLSSTQRCLGVAHETSTPRSVDEGLVPELPLRSLAATPPTQDLAQKMQDLAQAVGGLPLALTLLGNYLRKQASDGRITSTLERLSNAQVRLQITEPPISVESHPALSDATSLSLQSVIAVTDQLLGEAARTAFYRLAIFPPKPNSFSEEAALAVTASTFDELDVLSDIGLLENYGDRCTLHQVISDYAHIHLPEQEEHNAYDRLITYIADYVEAHKKDYELLDLESNTIYLVLSKAHEQEKQAELVRVVCAFAPFLILRGFYQEAQRHLQRAHEAARALNNNDGIARTLLYLGEIEQRLGNYAQAASSLQEGLILARQMNNHERICAFLTQLGIVLQEQGNLQQAEATYQEGLTLARNVADNEKICTLLNKLGSVNMRLGELAQSENYLQEGLALARKMDDHERIGGLLRILGALDISRGNFVQAQSYLQEGLTIARQLGDGEQVCALLNNLGLAAAQQGKNAQAKRYYQEGLELARQIGHRERICNVLLNLGDIFVEEDNYIQAEISLQKGLELARQIGHREWISALLINLGLAARKQGHYDDAKPYLQESLALASQIGQLRTICVILCELGNLSLSQGNTSSADEYFGKMLEQIPSGDQELLALAYYGLARVSALEGDRENAKLYGNKSITIFEMMKHRNVTEVRDWMKSVLD